MSMTEDQWAALLLSDIPAPVTPANEADIEVWMANEEPPAQWWGGYGTPADPTRLNPLNASVGSGAGGGISSGGLGSYPDLTTAAKDTAGMIDQTNMAPIKAVLEQGNASQAAFGQAVISTPWASSHYGGDVSRFTGTPNPGPAVTSPQAIGTGQTTTGATPASLTGLNLNPADGFGLIGNSITKTAGTLLGVAAGAALVVAGLWKLANPGQSLSEAFTQAAPLAAAAAA